MAKDHWDDFSQRTSFRTLCLKVDDSVFWVSREEFAQLSGVVKTMLYGDLEEADTVFFPLFKVRVKETADDFLEFLRCIFRTGAKTKDVDAKNVKMLLKYAETYEIAYLMEKCKKFLIKRTERMIKEKNKEKVLDIFKLGVKYKFKEIVRWVLPFVARFDSETLNKVYVNLPTEIRLVIKTQEAGHVSEHQFDQYGGWLRCSTWHMHLRKQPARRCKLCWFICCESCRWANLEEVQAFHVGCFVCHSCKKPSVVNYWGKDNDPFDGCGCVKKEAAAELDKIGL